MNRMMQKITELARMAVDGGGLAELLREHGQELRASDGVGDTGDIDARYFPSDKTIRKISLRAISGQRLDKYDQPAVAKLVEREKAANPYDKWFLRHSGSGSDFLLVHQTAAQRRMLQVGGGNTGF